ncbi:MAG: hypothetical protein HJJLKODD_02723 [Phycisphaerae bacterium]|nr:hypothetical protein [Phycisphaerae bacterium]
MICHGQEDGEHAHCTLAEEAEHAVGVSAFECYQCGKCTAGCPLAAEMDWSPHQILRLLQYAAPELEEQALRSLSIWLCLTCEQCVTRCPQEIDLPRLMEYLRQQSLERGLMHPQGRDILAFHEAFLDSVRKHGRLQEVGLVANYKLKTGHLLQDVLVAPRLLARGKLKLLPQGIKGKAAVRRIFERLQHDEGKEE